MVAALPPILDGTCIGDITTDMADVILSSVAELAPRLQRPRGAQGWYAGPGVDAEMNAAWQKRDKARRHIRAEPPQQQPSNGRENGWNKSSEGSQGCRAKILLELRKKNSKQALEKATKPASTSI